jgi:hypothetical protein
MIKYICDCCGEEVVISKTGLPISSVQLSRVTDKGLVNEEKTYCSVCTTLLVEAVKPKQTIKTK